ncbi:MAG: hypothetical protein G01um101444_396 [Parcubacteria group bacterium Gr01-1014_44]|nr:MAG: hypothetical protein G01um101444_396 [Parcubacteria group bacterium Gr01-1014_44]
MPTSPNKTESEKLFIILILFLGFAVSFLLAFNAKAPSTSQPPLAVRGEISPELGSVNLDFSVLDGVLFKQLKVFGVIPVNPGQTGRDNPFSPF